MFFILLKNIIGFQAPVTPIMEGIIDLHNYIFFYLILVFCFVLWMYSYIIYEFYIIPTYLYNFVHRKIYFYKNFFYFQKYILFIGYDNPTYEAFMIIERDRFQGFMYLFQFFKSFIINNALIRYKDILVTREITHNALIEIIWTIIPSIILILIAIPSFSLLYAMDEIIDPKLTVKAIGYQWFWTYEYAQAFEYKDFDYLKDSLGYEQRFYRDYLIYDSVMLTDDELVPGYYRLLDVDHQMILPTNIHIRIMVTGADVLHSWAVPSLGVKIDAIPGRMNQVGVFIKHEGTFYGQCSELCGVNHGFMPIVVKAVSYDTFIKWYRNIETIWYL